MKGCCLGEELLESAGPKMRVVFHGIECLYCDFFESRLAAVTFAFESL